MKKQKNTGISIIEILITIAILGILTAVSVSVFSSLANSQSLDKETEIVVSYINKARNNAINSLDFSTHGVSFASSTVAVFHGTNPATAPTTTTYTLSSKQAIWYVTLLNGQSYLYFNKLTGKPNTSGTLHVRDGSGNERVITIYATGLVEVQ